MLLRGIYRPGFFLVGIAEDDDAQLRYLKDELGLTDDEAQKLISRDQDEHLHCGQRTRDTFYLADVFIQRSDDLYKISWNIFGHRFRPSVSDSKEGRTCDVYGVRVCGQVCYQRERQVPLCNDISVSQLHSPHNRVRNQKSLLH